MKDDEKKFLQEVFERCRCFCSEHEQDGCSPRDIINEIGFYMSCKRAWYLLEKWARKGFYDYGVSSDLGWLTPEGVALAKTLEN